MLIVSQSDSWRVRGESGNEPLKMNIDLFNSVIVADWHPRRGDTAKLYYYLLPVYHT